LNGNAKFKGENLLHSPRQDRIAEDVSKLDREEWGRLFDYYNAKVKNKEEFQLRYDQVNPDMEHRREGYYK